MDGGDAGNHGRSGRYRVHEEARGEGSLYAREQESLDPVTRRRRVSRAREYLETFAKIQKAGAPIEWVAGRNPIPASTHLLGIYAHARHPNAAKLFVDFLLSREGQSLTANVIGTYPANPDVESELRKKTAGYRLHPVNPKMMSRFDEINKQ